MRSKIYLILFALFAFSCSSDSSSNDGTNNNSGSIDNSGNVSTENALLVSQISVQDGGLEIENQYFTYDGNKITTMSSVGSFHTELLNFIYTDDKISRIDRYFDTSDGIYSRFYFFYDSENRLSSFEHCYFDSSGQCGNLDTFSFEYSSNGTVTQNYSYDYGNGQYDTGSLLLQLDNNGNITSGTDTFQESDENGNQINITVNANIEHDNFNSPFKNIVGIDPFILFEIIDSEFSYNLSFSYFNNVTLIDYSYSNNPENYSVTFAYDYNEDDYPRQVIVNENGSSEQNIDIAYY